MEGPQRVESMTPTAGDRLRLDLAGVILGHEDFVVLTAKPDALGMVVMEMEVHGYCPHIVEQMLDAALTTFRAHLQDKADECSHGD